MGTKWPVRCEASLTSVGLSNFIILLVLQSGGSSRASGTTDTGLGRPAFSLSTRASLVSVCCSQHLMRMMSARLKNSKLHNNWGRAVQGRNTCQVYPIIELRDLSRQSEDAGRKYKNWKTNICWNDWWVESAGVWDGEWLLSRLMCEFNMTDLNITERSRQL